MIELLLTACLVANPSDCRTDTINIEEATTIEDCLHSGIGIVETWRTQTLTHEMSHWVCRDESGHSEQGFSIREIAPGVFVHRGAHALPREGNANDLSNAGFIIGEESVAVIDSGGSKRVGERLIAAIRHHTNKPIRYLILTHMHPDHVLGSTAFKAIDTTIIGHQNLPQALSMRAETYEASMQRLIGEAMTGSRIILPDETFDKSYTLELGNRRLTLQAHPTAHTDNDVTLLDETTGTLFLGDLLFHGHTPAIDGSIKGWLSLMDKLDMSGVKRIVPGHGPESLDWPDGAEPMLTYLRTLASEVRTAISRGDTMTHAIRHAGQSMRAGWHLFDEFHPRNVTSAYKELEWE